MRPFIFFIIIIAVVVLVEIYIYRGIRSIIGPENQKIYHILYYLTVFLTITGILSLSLNAGKGIGQTSLLTNSLFGLAFTLILVKLVIADILLVEDIYRLIRFTVEKISELRISKEGQEGISSFLEKRKPYWRE